MFNYILWWRIKFTWICHHRLTRASNIEIAVVYLLRRYRFLPNNSKPFRGAVTPSLRIRKRLPIEIMGRCAHGFTFEFNLPDKRRRDAFSHCDDNALNWNFNIKRQLCFDNIRINNLLAPPVAFYLYVAAPINPASVNINKVAQVSSHRFNSLIMEWGERSITRILMALLCRGRTVRIRVVDVPNGGLCSLWYTSGKYKRTWTEEMARCGVYDTRCGFFVF